MPPYRLTALDLIDDALTVQASEKIAQDQKPSDDAMANQDVEMTDVAEQEAVVTNTTEMAAAVSADESPKKAINPNGYQAPFRMRSPGFSFGPREYQILETAYKYDFGPEDSMTSPVFDLQLHEDEQKEDISPPQSPSFQIDIGDAAQAVQSRIASTDLSAATSSDDENASEKAVRPTVAFKGLMSSKPVVETKSDNDTAAFSDEDDIADEPVRPTVAFKGLMSSKPVADNQSDNDDYSSDEEMHDVSDSDYKADSESDDERDNTADAKRPTIGYKGVSDVRTFIESPSDTEDALLDQDMQTDDQHKSESEVDESITRPTTGQKGLFSRPTVGDKRPPATAQKGLFSRPTVGDKRPPATAQKTPFSRPNIGDKRPPSTAQKGLFSRPTIGDKRPPGQYQNLATSDDEDNVSGHEMASDTETHMSKDSPDNQESPRCRTTAQKGPAARSAVDDNSLPVESSTTAAETVGADAASAEAVPVVATKTTASTSAKTIPTGTDSEEQESDADAASDSDYESDTLALDVAQQASAHWTSCIYIALRKRLYMTNPLLKQSLATKVKAWTANRKEKLSKVGRSVDKEVLEKERAMTKAIAMNEKLRELWAAPKRASDEDVRNAIYARIDSIIVDREELLESVGEEDCQPWLEDFIPYHGRTAGKTIAPPTPPTTEAASSPSSQQIEKATTTEDAPVAAVAVVTATPTVPEPAVTVVDEQTDKVDNEPVVDTNLDDDLGSLFGDADDDCDSSFGDSVKDASTATEMTTAEQTESAAATADEGRIDSSTVTETAATLVEKPSMSVQQEETETEASNIVTADTAACSTMQKEITIISDLPKDTVTVQDDMTQPLAEPQPTAVATTVAPVIESLQEETPTDCNLPKDAVVVQDDVAKSLAEQQPNVADTTDAPVGESLQEIPIDDFILPEDDMVFQNDDFFNGLWDAQMGGTGFEEQPAQYLPDMSFNEAAMFEPMVEPLRPAEVPQPMHTTVPEQTMQFEVQNEYQASEPQQQVEEIAQTVPPAPVQNEYQVPEPQQPAIQIAQTVSPAPVQERQADIMDLTDDHVPINTLQPANPILSQQPAQKAMPARRKACNKNKKDDKPCLPTPPDMASSNWSQNQNFSQQAPAQPQRPTLSIQPVQYLDQSWQEKNGQRNISPVFPQQSNVLSNMLGGFRGRQVSGEQNLEEEKLLQELHAQQAAREQNNVREAQQSNNDQGAEASHFDLNAKMPNDQMPVTQVPNAQMAHAQTPVTQMPVDQKPVTQMPLPQMSVAHMPVTQMHRAPPGFNIPGPHGAPQFAPSMPTPQAAQVPGPAQAPLQVQTLRADHGVYNAQPFGGNPAFGATPPQGFSPGTAINNMQNTWRAADAPAYVSSVPTPRQNPAPKKKAAKAAKKKPTGSGRPRGRPRNSPKVAPTPKRKVGRPCSRDDELGWDRKIAGVNFPHGTNGFSPNAKGDKSKRGTKYASSPSSHRSSTPSSSSPEQDDGVQYSAHPEARLGLGVSAAQYVADQANKKKKKSPARSRKATKAMQEFPDEAESSSAVQQPAQDGAVQNQSSIPNSDDVFEVPAPAANMHSAQPAFAAPAMAMNNGPQMPVAPMQPHTGPNSAQIPAPAIFFSDAAQQQQAVPHIGQAPSQGDLFGGMTQTPQTGMQLQPAQYMTQTPQPIDTTHGVKRARDEDDENGAESCAEINFDELKRFRDTVVAGRKGKVDEMQILTQYIQYKQMMRGESGSDNISLSNHNLAPPKKTATRSKRQKTTHQAAVQQAPVQQTPARQTPVQHAPLHQIPVQQNPVPQTPVQRAPVPQTPVQHAPVQQSPIQQTPVQQAPGAIQPNSVPFHQNGQMAPPGMAQQMHQQMHQRMYDNHGNPMFGQMQHPMFGGPMHGPMHGQMMLPNVGTNGPMTPGNMMNPMVGGYGYAYGNGHMNQQPMGYEMPSQNGHQGQNAQHGGSINNSAPNGQVHQDMGSVDVNWTDFPTSVNGRS